MLRLILFNSSAWDVTRWAYDAATGLCTSKTYADGSTVAYTHTPDGLPLRTTYASGKWKENVYDAQRKVVGCRSSDGTGDAAFAHDDFGRLVLSSNGIATATRILADNGTATNEAWAVGGESATLVRELDERGRLVALVGRDDAPSLSAASAQRYTYDTDGRLAAVSNAEAVVTYAYAPDGRDAGYTLTLANGTAFTRTVVRDPFRRDLVARIENRVNGASVESLAYAYDALSRPVSRNGDAFGYNARGEVVFSRGDAENAEEAYAYDPIGNAVLAASGGITNAYTANALNQYTQVGRAAPCPPTTDGGLGQTALPIAPTTDGGLGQTALPTTPAYDADGNLTAFGPRAFAYDAASRLVSVSSNGVLLVTRVERVPLVE